MPAFLVEDTIFITLDGEHSSPLLLREALSFKSVSKHTACSGGRPFLFLEHFLGTHSFKDSSGKRVSLVTQMVKHLPAMRKTQVQSLGQQDPLEKEMASHSSTLAWKIPWTQEPGRLHSQGSQRVGYD